MFNCITWPLIRDVLLCASIEIIISYLERITWSKCFLLSQKCQASGVHNLLVAVGVPINTQEGQPMAPEPSRPSSSPAVKDEGCRNTCPCVQGSKCCLLSVRYVHLMLKTSLTWVRCAEEKPQVFTTVCESREKCSHWANEINICGGCKAGVTSSALCKASL